MIISIVHLFPEVFSKHLRILRFLEELEWPEHDLAPTTRIIGASISSYGNQPATL